MCDAFVQEWGIPGVENLSNKYSGIFSYDKLSPGIYMIVPHTSPEQGDSGNVLTSKPFIFNNLKYDENGNVVGAYSELNLTVYLDVIFADPDYEITKTVISSPANGEAYQVGEKIKYKITVTNKGNCNYDVITINDIVSSGEGENTKTEKTIYLDLRKGESEDVEYEYEVKPDDGGYPIKNTITGVTTRPPTTREHTLPEVEITNVEKEKEPIKGKIKVKKTLTDLDGNELMATNSTFYVALFSDEDLTDRVSEVLPMVFNNASSAEVEFTNLDLSTYYVSEVEDEYWGYPIDYGENEEGGMFTAIFPYENSVEITEENPEGLVEFENVFPEWSGGTGGESIEGGIKVRKTLKTLTGDDLTAVDSTFYVALFSDEGRTNRVSDVLPMVFVGSSSAEVEFKDLGAGTYYVSEVDENGTPIDNGITKDGGVFGVIFPGGNKVEISERNTGGFVQFENVFSEQPREY